MPRKRAACSTTTSASCSTRRTSLAKDLLPEQAANLTEAFTTLAPEIVCVEAKDVVGSGFSAPGSGALGFNLVYRLRASLPRPVPVVIQDTAESEAPRAAAHLRAIAMAHPFGSSR